MQHAFHHLESTTICGTPLVRVRFLLCFKLFFFIFVLLLLLSSNLPRDYGLGYATKTIQQRGNLFYST